MCTPTTENSFASGAIDLVALLLLFHACISRENCKDFTVSRSFHFYNESLHEEEHEELHEEHEELHELHVESILDMSIWARC